MLKKEFCYNCGKKLVEEFIDGRNRLVCASCGEVNYVNPVPAAAVVIIRDGKILLVKRAVEPKKGLWSLPAGFVEIDESVDDCAVREVLEETSLDIEITGILDVFSIFDDPRYVCLLVVYTGRIIGGELNPGDDASEAAFFSPDDLPPIAFKKHRDAIEKAFARKN